MAPLSLWGLRQATTKRHPIPHLLKLGNNPFHCLWLVAFPFFLPELSLQITLQSSWKAQPMIASISGRWAMGTFLGRYHCLVLSNNLRGLGVLTNLVLWVFIRCKHYRRRCKIRAPCCNEIYPCRHCHNEATVGKCYYICIEILELSSGFCASSWSWCLLFFMDLLEYVEKPFWSAWTRSMRR